MNYINRFNWFRKKKKEVIPKEDNLSIDLIRDMVDSDIDDTSNFSYSTVSFQSHGDIPDFNHNTLICNIYTGKDKAKHNFKINNKKYITGILLNNDYLQNHALDSMKLGTFNSESSQKIISNFIENEGNIIGMYYEQLNRNRFKEYGIGYVIIKPNLLNRNYTFTGDFAEELRQGINNPKLKSLSILFYNL
jgi:hypothetical protein